MRFQNKRMGTFMVIERDDIDAVAAAQPRSWSEVRAVITRVRGLGRTTATVGITSLRAGPCTSEILSVERP
jgi:hypothetical protein